MAGEHANAFYHDFLDDLRAKYGAGGQDKIQNGKFGVNMQVELINEGPTTIILDSAEGCPPRPAPKVALSPEEKAKFKEKQAAKAAAQKARREQMKSTPTSEQSGASTPAQEAQQEANEDKGATLAARFKEAMTESY